MCDKTVTASLYHPLIIAIRGQRQTGKSFLLQNVFNRIAPPYEAVQKHIFVGAAQMPTYEDMIHKDVYVHAEIDVKLVENLWKAQKHSIKNGHRHSLILAFDGVDYSGLGHTQMFQEVLSKHKEFKTSIIAAEIIPYSIVTRRSSNLVFLLGKQHVMNMVDVAKECGPLCGNKLDLWRLVADCTKVPYRAFVCHMDSLSAFTYVAQDDGVDNYVGCCEPICTSCEPEEFDIALPPALKRSM